MLRNSGRNRHELAGDAAQAATSPSTVSGRCRIGGRFRSCLVKGFHQILLARLGREVVFRWNCLAVIVEAERASSRVCRVDMALGLVDFSAIAAAEAVDRDRR